MVESIVESHWVATARVSEDVLHQKMLAVMRKLLGPDVSEAKVSPRLHLQLSELEHQEQIRQEMEQNPILEP